ncbi:TPA: hypothetical protein RQS77_002587 [Staphylococcus aureus]|nr:hypothetical protein [Staphylococcus aureus]HDE8062659.1 hypothetical protein [Staphylococcus aureus]HDY4438027.1 hypothetical protein [Staphylococcus aureus]HDY4575530.1 hypothetical protein [Staphylococcus aureus]HEA5167587.1 hypothetical protein [Staphylococcus aureus]
MNIYENILYQMILTILLIYCIFFFSYKAMLLPKKKCSSIYVNIKAVIIDGILTSVKLILTFVITGIIFHAFKETKLNFPTQEDSNDLLLYMIFITFAVIISALTVISFKSIYRFFNKLILYISLRKNTVSNNLRHAIANKEQSEIIKYHKLIKQTNEKIDLSLDEILTLMACLMNAGYNEDVRDILSPKLQQKHSLFQRYMTSNPEIAEYEIKGIDNSIKKSDTFKHKLSMFEEKSQKIASLIAIILVVQFIIILLSSMGFVSNVFKSIFVMSLSILVTSTIIIKYKKLKDIYRREFDKDKINMKPAPLDKLQLVLSVVMFITGVSGLVYI